MTNTHTLRVVVHNDSAAALFLRGPDDSPLGQFQYEWDEGGWYEIGADEPTTDRAVIAALDHGVRSWQLKVRPTGPEQANSGLIGQQDY